MRFLSMCTFKKPRFIAVLVLIGIVTTLPAFAAPPVEKNNNNGLRNEKKFREQRQKEYVRQHSDSSGKVRPEAYLKGIEHVRQMKVAPYIGAKPLGESPAKPAGPPANGK